jgi:hypothetical protein
LRWKPTSHNIKFDDLNKNPARKQLINHLEVHSEITNKGNLFYNVRAFCSRHRGINMDEFIPKTYILNIDSYKYDSELALFLQAF